MHFIEVRFANKVHDDWKGAENTHESFILESMKQLTYLPTALSIAMWFSSAKCLTFLPSESTRRGDFMRSSRRSRSYCIPCCIILLPVYRARSAATDALLARLSYHLEGELQQFTSSRHFIYNIGMHWIYQHLQQEESQPKLKVDMVCRTPFEDALPAAAADGFETGSYLVNGTGVVYDANSVVVRLCSVICRLCSNDCSKIPTAPWWESLYCTFEFKMHDCLRQYSIMLCWWSWLNLPVQMWSCSLMISKSCPTHVGSSQLSSFFWGWQKLHDTYDKQRQSQLLSAVLHRKDWACLVWCSSSSMEPLLAL